MQHLCTLITSEQLVTTNAHVYRIVANSYSSIIGAYFDISKALN